MVLSNYQLEQLTFEVIIVLDFDIYLPQRAYLHKTGIKTNVAFNFTTIILQVNINHRTPAYHLTRPEAILYNISQKLYINVVTKN